RRADYSQQRCRTRSLSRRRGGVGMSTLLKAQDLISGYGRSQVLYGMHLQVDAGQCVALLGRNGMGKTTTIVGLMGLHRVGQGQIQFNGAAIERLPSHRVARQGLGLVPEGRRVFPNLTVKENLVATAADRRNKTTPWTLQRIYQLFPRLQERTGHFGNQLSGGEQQMLAISRALMTNPE